MTASLAPQDHYGQCVWANGTVRPQHQYEWPLQNLIHSYSHVYQILHISKYQTFHRLVRKLRRSGGARASFKWDPFPNPIWISSKMLGSDSNNVCTEISSLYPKLPPFSIIFPFSPQKKRLRCWMADNQCQFFAKASEPGKFMTCSIFVARIWW